MNKKLEELKDKALVVVKEGMEQPIVVASFFIGTCLLISKLLPNRTNHYIYVNIKTRR